MIVFTALFTGDLSNLPELSSVILIGAKRELITNKIIIVKTKINGIHLISSISLYIKAFIIY
ncbi:hypothetical protein OAK17_06745 [Alphaproteobacteria bacterium]|nr:hypothetical protein [Alphaproteobacteria bacterium]